jgi:hypothetical protein
MDVRLKTRSTAGRRRPPQDVAGAARTRYAPGPVLVLTFQVVPLALYAGFAPMAALVCVLLLEPPAPLRRAGAFVAG